MQLLADRGECSVEELSRTLRVSDMTIRRDLAKLAVRGEVVRTHGGASPANLVSFEFQFLKRAQENAPAKQQIALAAAALIRDGQSILFDSGSTTLAVARQLVNRRKLTVVTTSLPIASVFQRAAGVDTLLLGGYVRRDSPDLEGPLTEANLDYLRADVAFLGADGIDPDGNVYNASLNLARMLTKMVTSSEKVFVVADHSKLGRRALASFGNLSAWAGLITDSRADAATISRLRDAGIKVTEAAAHE
jgi:DeoR/GlpR family transcriptional regulator of sugar metabolism